jgi:hypothetical protein
MDLLHLALEKIGTPCREYIKAYHIEGKSYQEMILEGSSIKDKKLSYEALRKRMSDCIQKLKVIINSLT